MATTETTEKPMSAATINDHLERGGFVQITTYTRSTVYSRKNAGQFFDRDGNTFVRRGRKSVDCLTMMGGRWLVGIRFSK